MGELSKTCGNCRFWGSDEPRYPVGDDRYDDDKFKTCTAVKHFTGYDQSETDKFPAYVCDGSGYYAALRCHSDFGCNLFEMEV